MSEALVTTVTQSTTSQVALADKARLGFFVLNDATATAYLKFSGAASVTDFSVRIAPGGLYEAPAGSFYGDVNIVWAASGSGKARITEVL